MNTLRTARNIAAGLGAQLWMSALGLLALPVIVRGFGPEAYGLLSLNLTLVGAASVCDLGIGIALAKYVAETTADHDQSRTNVHVSTALTLVLFLSIVTTIAGIGLAPALATHILRIPAPLENSARISFLITSATIPAILLRILCNGILVGQHRITYLSATNALIGTLKILAGVAVAVMRPEIHILVLAFAVLSYAHAALLAVMCFGSRRSSIRIRFGWNLRVAKELTKLGCFSSLSVTAGYVFLYADRWLIATFLPLNVLGYYSLAFEIGSKQWYIANSISQAYFPVFGGHAQRSDGIRSTYMQALKLLSLGCTGAALVLAIFARQLLATWISPDYGQNAASLLTILSFGILIACYLNIPATAILAASGRPQITAGLFGLAAVLHCTVSLVAMRWLGAEGVALGFCAGYTFVFLGSTAWLSRQGLIPGLYEVLRRCLLPSVGAALFVSLVAVQFASRLLTHVTGVLLAMALTYLMYLPLAAWLTFTVAERENLVARLAAVPLLRSALSRY